jgi:triacylglycerol esterase/lipase EstA (alpha/beta hydrolase family)
MRRGLSVLGVGAIALTLRVPGVAAQAQDYAPLAQEGPALSVAADALDAALECSQDSLAGLQQNPILLVPGTNLEPHANFDWNYASDFTNRGWAYCMVTLPSYGLEDIQVSGEYIVHAIRTMAEASGRDVDIVGYSQGGMVPRWGLRFWPDTRALVGDLVGLAPSNHGTVDSDITCEQPCAPAHRQQASQSQFIAALNSRAETFAGIDYSSIYTHYDEIVVPNLDENGSSSLRTGEGTRSNVALQDVCPTNTADHLAIGSYDAVAHALVVDALTHDGPSDPSRISIDVCATPFQPGVEPSTFAGDFAKFLQVIGESGGTVENTSSEPPLKCYVTATCGSTPGSAVAPATSSAAPGAELPATGNSLGLIAAVTAVAGVALRRLRRRATTR